MLCILYLHVIRRYNLQPNLNFSTTRAWFVYFGLHLQILSSVERQPPSRSHSSPETSFATPIRRASLLSHDLHEMTPFSPESVSDDNVSLSSATSLNKKMSTTAFQIPDTWRPSIMQCLRKETDEERRLELDTSRRNEVVRDLVTQMFAIDPKPFAALVAKKIVRKYPFMRDIGDKVSGYVSFFRVFFCVCGGGGGGGGGLPKHGCISFLWCYTNIFHLVMCTCMLVRVPGRSELLRGSIIREGKP